jgi:DNA-binding cell septation regulator SpoVG
MPEKRSPAPLGANGNRAATSEKFAADQLMPSGADGKLHLPVRVAALYQTDKAGAIKVFADVEIGPLLIFGVKVVQQPGAAAWVAMPSQKRGNGKYSHVVKISSKELMAQISAAVFAAWERANGREA